MSNSTDSDEQIRQLFRTHVPEVATGRVELASIAREPGKLVMVAVRSHDSTVDPVGACVGLRGVHPKTISQELGSDKVSIVLWSESPDLLIRYALAPYGPATEIPTITLDPVQHVAKVEVDRATLAYFSGEAGLRVRLASRVAGWDIQFVSHEHE